MKPHNHVLFSAGIVFIFLVIFWRLVVWIYSAPLIVSRYIDQRIDDLFD